MTVLVTGGAGYIGSHMVFELLDRGEDVVVIDNLSTGAWWVLPPEANLIEGDIGDETLLDRVLGRGGVDTIVHFAGSIVVPDSVSDPLGYYLNNTVKSRELIAAAVRHGVANFIFSSTAAVYGEPKTIPVSEDAQTVPVSPYGKSKLMTEWMLADSAHAHGLNYVSLRYFNVAGADPKGRTGQSNPRATHLIKVACQTLLGQRGQMEVFGTDYETPDGTCIRDYIHVSDLIAAHVDAMTHLRSGRQGGVFNCGYGRGYSVLEVIRAVERAGQQKLNVRLAGRRAGDSARIVASADRARTILRWSPRWDNLDEIVTSALTWEKKLMRHNAGS
ncbi:MAG TPA: UDP-glucose 4-epimerase GalE [Aestuariivirgaceae bacterium]|jgi:UDP-glucose 4-epimerase